MMKNGGTSAVVFPGMEFGIRDSLQAGVAQTFALKVCGSSLDSGSRTLGRASSFEIPGVAREEPRISSTGVRATPILPFRL